MITNLIKNFLTVVIWFLIIIFYINKVLII